MHYLLNPYVPLALIVVLLAAVVLSFVLGPANMIQNLIAELVGVALGVCVTIWFVERLLERRRRERWEEVRGQLFRAISSHIVDIAWTYTVRVRGDAEGFWYFAPLTKGRSKPTTEAADAMSTLLDKMREQPNVAQILQLFRETESHFDHLRDVLATRLIEFGAEPKLVQLLRDMDGRHWDWKKQVVNLHPELEQEPKILFTIFGVAMDALEASIALYRYLATSQASNPI